MEDIQEAIMNATMQELPLMADSTEPELQLFDSDVAATPKRGNDTTTAIYIDIGSSSGNMFPPQPNYDETPDFNQRGGFDMPVQFVVGGDIFTDFHSIVGDQEQPPFYGSGEIERDGENVEQFDESMAFQNLISNGPMLAPLPQSCPTQPNFNNIPTQGINQNMAEQFSIFLDSAKEMMGNLFGRLDGVCTSLKESSESMKHLTGVIAEREEGSKKRHEERKRKDLDMCIGMKNGDVMYVDEPAQSQTGNLFDKQKRTVKEMGFWLQNRATVEDLNGPWIQFQDNPRFTIDGNYINKFVNTEVDVDQKMAFAIARLLNRGPGKQEADSGYTCHFLLHDWAAKALHDSSTAEDCIPLFDRHGLKKSKLVKCNKIVPFVLLGGKWLSVSIDIPGRSTTLIHPTAAQRPVNEVEEQFKPMCHRLTKFALSNISALTMKNIKHEHWSYNVALREEHTFTPNNAGAIAFYYSIPRENQFMAVSDAPVTNVKMNFVHELIKMCSKTTNKTVKRCAIRNPPAPPAPPAPKVLKAADQGDGRALKRARKQKEKLEDGDCSESGSCSKNEFD